MFWRTLLFFFGTYQALRTSVYVGVAKARIAHGRGVDQGRDFSEVFGAELVKDADVRVFELSEELDGIGPLISFTPLDRKSHVGHSRCISQAGRSWTVTAPTSVGNGSRRQRREATDPSRSSGYRSCNVRGAHPGVYPSVGERNA